MVWFIKSVKPLIYDLLHEALDIKSYPINN